MPNTTTNYGLVKPLETEFYDIAIFNSNADKVDTALKEIDDSLTDRINTAIGGAIGGTY